MNSTMKTKYRIYHLEDSIRDSCIVDINEIDGHTIRSLDEYAFRFKVNWILVYGYLKTCKKPTKLSYLHKIFTGNHTLEHFDSAKHLKYYAEDEDYRNVINKYVRNKYTWCKTMSPLQSYFFDSKYLLMGNYQKIAKKNAMSFFTSQNTHYSVMINRFKVSQKHVDYYNIFFEEKKALEKQFYNEYLKQYNNPNLTFLFHYNKIEIFDKVSQLFLQIELNHGGIYDSKICFSTNKKKNRTVDESKRLALNIIVKNPDISHLYNRLITGEGVAYVNNYLNQVDALKLTDQYQHLFVSYESLIKDIKNREESCYFDDEYFIDTYLVHNKYYEKVRVNKIFSGEDIRLSRIVNFKLDGEYTEMELKSFRLKGDIREQTEYFIMSDLLNIGHVNREHNTFEYELMCQGDHVDYMIAFMREPTLDATRLFNDYVEVQRSMELDVEYHLDNNIKIKDTRDKCDKRDRIISLFERYAKDWRIEYTENVDNMIDDRNKLMVKLAEKLYKIPSYMEKNKDYYNRKILK